MVVSYADVFKRQVRRLGRKYRHIRSDIEPVIRQLEAGETPGDRLQGIDHTLYKVRVKNSDAKRGKSGGYRVIYYLQTSEHTVLVAIYSKTEQSDIDLTELAEILREEGQSSGGG